MTKIIPIVEGHGDAMAVPLLLRRLLQEQHEFYYAIVGQAMRGRRSQLVDPEELKRWITLAWRKNKDCGGIFVVFDADDADAKSLGPHLLAHARIVSNGLPVYVVLAVREYEAWLLASIDSLKGKGTIVEAPALPAGGPESVRDAKGWVERNLAEDRPYAETVDQERLTALLDFRLAYAGSESFRRLFADVADLVRQMGGAPKALKGDVTCADDKAGSN